MLDFIDSDSDSDNSEDLCADQSLGAFNEISTLAFQAIIQHRKVKSGQLVALYLQSDTLQHPLVSFSNHYWHHYCDNYP